jgi:hypothetical protein
MLNSAPDALVKEYEHTCNLRIMKLTEKAMNLAILSWKSRCVDVQAEVI